MNEIELKEKFKEYETRMSPGISEKDLQESFTEFKEIFADFLNVPIG